MDAEIQEIREKIDELSELMKENSRMTKSLYRRAQFASVFMGVKWIIIIGLAIGSLYFIQPYLESLMGTYEAISGMTKGANAAGSSSSGSSILDLVKNL